MEKIYSKIKFFLKDYHIDNQELTYLVGFSGGFDSMCLLHALKNITNNKIIAIHLNHNWRGDESDREEQNCRKFCKKTGVEFYSESIDVPHSETEARKARYDFFEKCAKKFNTNVIFTAHNKNDQAETIIFRICHGTGVKGLCGISPKRDIYFRPLLDIERNEIEKYCQDNNLTPNYDSSNADIIHKRNLIRANILPLMKEINPEIINALSSLAKIATEETEIIQSCTQCYGKINTKEFLEKSDALQKRIIYELITPLVPQNYDRERVLTLWEFIKGNYSSKSGKTISVTTNYWLFVNENYIELIKKTKQEKINIKINKAGEYKYGGITLNISECDNIPEQGLDIYGETIYADLSRIDFDFELRNRQDGDIIRPLGLNGTQKLKKYLNERKIPNHEKENLLFLAQGKEILWAIGLGVSDKIKVQTKPTHKIIIKRNNYEY